MLAQSVFLMIPYQPMPYDANKNISMLEYSKLRQCNLTFKENSAAENVYEIYCE